MLGVIQITRFTRILAPLFVKCYRKGSVLRFLGEQKKASRSAAGLNEKLEMRLTRRGLQHIERRHQRTEASQPPRQERRCRILPQTP